MQVSTGDKSVLVLDSPPTVQEVNIMASAFESGSAARARRKTRGELAERQKKEKQALAEASSEVAITEASALSGKAGRKSLLKTSPTGLATNLGGASV